MTDDRMETITDPAAIRATDEPDERGDFPWHVGLYNRFEDAIGAASRNASLTRRKYKVRWEPNNRWWNVTEGARMKDEAQR